MIEESVAEKTFPEENPGEKKAQETHGKKAEAKKRSGFRMPIYFGVLFLVLGLVAGFAINSYMQTCPPTVNVIEGTCPPLPSELESVEIKILTSNEFNGLETDPNTVLAVFDARGVRYETETVNLDKEENSSLADDFGVVLLPAALVKASQLEAFGRTTSDLKKLVETIENEFEKVNGYYVVPETHLDGLSHVKVFLESPDEECSVEGGKSKVLLFRDFYGLESLTVTRWTPGLIENYEGFAEYEFIFNPGVSEKMAEKYGKEKVYLVEKYLLAAQEQGKYFELEKCLADVYCDKDNDGETTEDEINLCAEDNPHFGIPLTQAELDSCVAEAGLDETKLDAFLEDNPNEKLDAGFKRTKAYFFKGIDAVLAVVDCKITERVFKVDDIICWTRPELPVCQPPA